MSDDLVERLRAEGIAELDEAANRIEKLEAALAHISSWYPISVTRPLQTIHEIRDFARKALEGKDD